MNKIYTLFIALSILVVPNMFSQGPWTFTNTNDGWASTGTAANLTTSATYSVLDVNGAGNPQITRTDANVDGTTNTYAVIRIKNNTSNTLMRFIYNASGTNRFVDTQISTNDTNFKTYYVKVDANADWNTNPVNTITIQFRADHTNPPTAAVDDGLGNFYIDHFEIVATEISRTDFTFDVPDNALGFSGMNSTLTQDATTGVVSLDFTTQKFPGIRLGDTFKVPATNNNFVAITFDSNTATELNQITFKAEDPSNQFQSVSVAAMAGVQQTVIIDLTSRTSWDGDETVFIIQFKKNTGAAETHSGIVKINRVLFFNTQWTGNGDTDTDWNTAANWSTGTVPTATDVVHIPSGLTNNPIVSATTGAVTNDLIIDGSLTVENGGSLIVNGTSSGNVIHKIAIPDGNWHLIASPNTDESVYDFLSNHTLAIGSGTTPAQNVALAPYDNTQADANNRWAYYVDGDFDNANGDDTNDDMTSGKGFSIKLASAGDLTVVGGFKTDDLVTIITQNSTNWNLVGNPFSSYIQVSDVISANTANLSDAFEFVYVYDNNKSGGAGYTTLAGTDYIRPGQGFFVNAANSTADNFTISESLQSHQTGVTLYKTSAPKINLWLSDGSNRRTTEIEYNANATTSLDKSMDAGAFDGVATSFSLYSHLVSNSEGINFMRQVLPNSDFENMVVPVGIKAAAGKEISFSAEALNLPTGLKVFLEDTVTSTFTRLDEANAEYKITLDKALDGVGRFYLHTAQSVLSISDDVILNSVSIFKADNSTLRVTGLTQGKASISLFNIQGKEVFNTSFNASNVNDISIPRLSTGIYIAKLNSAKGSINQKIILE